MTVINTNVGALTARTYAVKANESMQKSMERLSSGFVLILQRMMQPVWLWPTRWRASYEA